MSNKTRFSQLSAKDKEFILDVRDRQIPATRKWDLITRQYGITGRSARNWIAWLTEEGKEEEVRLRANNRIWDPGSKQVYLFTWAQNATPFHDSLWRNMKAYAEFRGAKIGVIQGRYQNPTSVWNLKDISKEYWMLSDSEADYYLMGNRVTINDDATVLGDIKIRPTAVNPITSIYEITGAKSCIIGHPRVHMRTIPTVYEREPKTVWTTGAITRTNYTDSKAGKRAEFHHTYGFLIVEIDEHLTHIRQVTADDSTGDFYDLFYQVKDGKITKNSECEAQVLGDLHGIFARGSNLDVTLDLLDQIPPKRTVVHDVIDSYSISHHHRNDPFLQARKREQGTDSLQWEIDETFRVLNDCGFDTRNTYIVRSNHDMHIDRWLKEVDWRKDPTNARIYFKLGKMKLDQTNNPERGIFAALIEEKYGGSIKCLHPNESLLVKGFEVSMHGDIGANGSRGSVNQFRKLPTKTITGHSHAPARRDGALSVGLIPSVDKLEYMEGPHNKACANIIVHKDGKAQHVFIKQNRYTNINLNEGEV